ncbi:MAG: carboxylesterase/lipase family protein [Oscillospiraceae bacterium]|jgi:para-nitrobenzyl esterase|nr:carboxylesterase/lipase family protein [Oscillospiraceae bacterium]
MRITDTNKPTIADTRYGAVEGFAEDKVLMWFGIPYAKPPVGALRFKRSVSPEPWSGVKPCMEMGASPFQFGAGGIMSKLIKNAHPISEDCLTLNIWAPQDAQEAPVFIYIYGGANHLGESSTPSYSLHSFPKQGIIGVSFNYRVGPLGFYDFSRLDSSFDSNCAPSDMILAVRWVKENIEAFGGDPDNITICGESAGGSAVYTLLTAPSAHGTFNKAIAMSGLAGNVTTYRTHELNNSIFFDKLGIKPDEAAKLKAMPAAQMREAGSAVFTDSNVRYPGIFITGPVIDDLVPQHPWEALADGKAADIPCIFGSCRDEGTLFYMSNDIPKSWDKAEEMLRNSGCPEKLPALRQAYADTKGKKALKKLGGDRLFWADSIKCTLAQCAHSTVYSYRFDYAPALLRLIGLGASHGSDIGPALNTQSVFGGGKKRSEKAEKVYQVTHNAFVNFAKTGDPNGGLPIKWEPYDEKKRATFIINAECSVEYDPNRKRFEAWKDLKLYE